MYPDGLPSDYSVIATFRATKDTTKESWNLWQISDPEGQEQVGLRFQGDTRSLDFFFTSPHGSQMLRTFHGVEKVFDGEWHKVGLSVKGSQVKLLIDCEEIRVESIDEPRPIIHQGYTSIVKRAAGDRSVSVCWHFAFAIILTSLCFDFFYIALFSHIIFRFFQGGFTADGSVMWPRKGLFRRLLWALERGESSI